MLHLKMSKFAVRCWNAWRTPAGKRINFLTWSARILCIERPIPERHRIIFYLGHLEAFDWNLLQPRLPNAKTFDPDFDRLFRVRDRSGGRRSTLRSALGLARQAQIERYRNRIRTTLDAALMDRNFSDWAAMNLQAAAERRDRAPPDACRDSGVYAASIAVRSKTKRSSSARRQQAGPMRDRDGRDSRRPRPRSGFSRDDRGSFRLGQRIRGDNAVDVPAFVIDRYKVTNGQYLEVH